MRASEFYSLYSGSVFLRCPGKFLAPRRPGHVGAGRGGGPGKSRRRPASVLRFLRGRGKGWAARRLFRVVGTGGGGGKTARGRAGRGSRSGAGVPGGLGSNAEPRGGGGGGGSRVRIRVPARPRLEGRPSPSSRPSCLTPVSRGTLSPSLISGLSQGPTL